MSEDVKAAEKEINVDNGFVLTNRDGHVSNKTIEKLSAGCHEAFDVVYLSYKEPVERFLTILVGSRESALEITQDVFVTIWEKRADIDSLKNFKGYLFTTAKNKALKFLNYNKRLHNLAKNYDFAQNHDNITPEDQIIAKDLQLLIEIAVSNMPEQRREVYKMYDDGLSYEEIAAKLNITEANTRQHLSRARKSISKLLQMVIFLMIATQPKV